VKGKERGSQLALKTYQIAQLTSLTTLSLARNKFSGFPTDVFALEYIQTLDLSENEIDIMWHPEQFTFTAGGFSGYYY